MAGAVGVQNSGQAQMGGAVSVRVLGGIDHDDRSVARHGRMTSAPGQARFRPSDSRSQIPLVQLRLEECSFLGPRPAVDGVRHFQHCVVSRIVPVHVGLDLTQRPVELEL